MKKLLQNIGDNIITGVTKTDFGLRNLMKKVMDQTRRLLTEVKRLEVLLGRQLDIPRQEETFQAMIDLIDTSANFSKIILTCKICDYPSLEISIRVELILLLMIQGMEHFKATFKNRTKLFLDNLSQIKLDFGSRL